MTDGDNENGRGDQAPATRDTNTVNELREIATKLDGGRIFSGKMHAQAHSGGTCILRISKAVAIIKQLSEAQNRAITTTIKQLQEDRDKVIAAQNRPTKEAQERLNGELGQALKQINEARDRVFAEIQAGLEQLKKEKARVKQLEEKRLITVVKANALPNVSKRGNTKLQNAIFSEEEQLLETVNDNERMLFNITSSTNKPVNIIILFHNLTNSKIKLTEIHRVVLDAVSTLWQQGIHIFTLQQLYKYITGGRKYATTNQIQFIKKILIDLGSYFCNIDATEHIKRRIKNSEDINKYIYEGQLISRSFRHIELNGKTYDICIVTEEPPLFKYADDAGQVIQIPIEQLQIRNVVTKGNYAKKPIRKTLIHILVESYLERRIALMKHREGKGRGVARTIRTQTLLTEVGEKTATQDKRQDILTYAVTCLRYWKSTGWIAGYDKVETGARHEITAFQIVL